MLYHQSAFGATTHQGTSLFLHANRPGRVNLYVLLSIEQCRQNLLMCDLLSIDNLKYAQKGSSHQQTDWSSRFKR